MDIPIMEKIDDFVVTYVVIMESNGERWVNAYVYLDKMVDDTLSNETYREDNVVGVDTMHYYNIGKNLDSKFEDAKRQIKNVIEDYKIKTYKKRDRN